MSNPQDNNASEKTISNQSKEAKVQCENKSFDIPVNGYLSEDNENKIQYLEGIITKQLALYTWCEEKVNTLATIDSILLGAATFFIQHVKVVNNSASTQAIFINIGMILILLLPISTSLIITLWHIRPKMQSGAIPSIKPNHRSAAGITRFDNVAKYREHLGNLTASEICEDLTNQIYGMNKNIWENQKSIKMAVFFDMVGLAGFIFIILHLAIAT